MKDLKHSTWEATTQKKRSQRESLVKPFLEPNDAENVVSKEILENGDIETLVELFSSGKLKAQDLIRCYATK